MTAPRTTGQPVRRKTKTSPDRKVTAFDLDTLEREVQPEPFVIIVGGEEFTVRDPNDVDWQVVADVQRNVEDMETALQAFLGDQYERFRRHHVPVWKIEQVLTAAQTHYGADPAALGEGNASPTS